MDAPPIEISANAVEAAEFLVTRYFIPHAERVYGDVDAPAADAHAATLAQWLLNQRATRPGTINARKLRRETRLPGLTRTCNVVAAVAELIAAGWLAPPPPGTFQHTRRSDHPVNPAIWDQRT
jgi:hypothetical protein